MARNRKRAKERRARRPQAVSARSRAQADEPLGASPREQANRPLGAPNPLDHAAPDAEIAQAAEIPAELRDGEAFEEGGYDENGDALEEEAEDELEPSDLGQGPPDGGEGPPDAGDDDLAGAPVPAHGARVAAPRNRLLTFVQGSWRELQRVQWPDRRQVMQATGVVIGFVIVAGVFLGVSDWVASKIVSFVINGHF